MRILTVAIIPVLMCATPTASAGDKPVAFDWSVWRSLPVQDGGRQKPLDTLSWETLRLFSNRSSIADPETGQMLEPTAFYLSMLFDGQGWKSGVKGQESGVRSQESDRWDQAPLLRVDYLELRTLLGLKADEAYISPAELGKVVVKDPRMDKELGFTAWGDSLRGLEKQQGNLSELETKGLDLANRLAEYQYHRAGRGLEILPIPGSETKEWLSVSELTASSFNDRTDPTGQFRQIQRLFGQIRMAYREGDAEAFNKSSAELIGVLRSLGPDLGGYPTASQMSLEVAYNHWVPFRFAWVFMLSAVLVMLIHLGTNWRLFYFCSLAAFGGALIAMLTGFSLRIIISGRAPVTGMYESVVYVALGVAVMGLILGAIYRGKIILLAAGAVSTLALIVADSCPAVLDARLSPLQPVLRSNFWLTTHVMTITLSYAAFALAFGIGNVALWYFLVGSSNRNAIAALTRFIYKAIQVGVLLLAAGIILGGIWADYSWGRFWGWDPKEVWALVALLGYLAVLHARFAGYVGQRGLAALSVICFSLVVMAWYGVNFVLGTGLHSYGFGGGGQAWVGSAIVVELFYTGIALWRSRPRQEPGNRSQGAGVRNRESAVSSQKTEVGTQSTDLVLIADS